MGLFPSKPGAVRRVPTLPQECWASALDFLPYVDASVARRTCVLWRKSIDALLKNAQKKNPNIPRIARLVSSLRIGDPEGKRQAAMALDAMLLEEEDPVAEAADGLTIIDVGGLEALVDLMKGSDYNAKVRAALVLRRLSEDNAILSNVICIAGGIQLMVDLLCNGGHHGQFVAACALGVFTEADNFKNRPGVITAIMDAGAIAPLVKLLRAQCAFCRDMAMLTLCRMTCDYTGRSLMSSGRFSVQRERVTSAQRARVTSALLRAGVVPPLLDMLTPLIHGGTGTEYGQIHAVALVGALQAGCGSLDRHRMVDVYVPALKLLQTGSNEVKKQVARSLQQTASGAWVNLSALSKLSHRIYFIPHSEKCISGAIPPLMEMMRSDDPETQELAAEALVCLVEMIPIHDPETKKLAAEAKAPAKAVLASRDLVTRIG